MCAVTVAEEAGTPHPTISAVVISCNDADVIEACLESVAGWVDEIVVVDMHSMDGTRDIACRYGARIIDHDRLTYVEPVRNFALQQATCDWIIMLDPDERVPEPLADRLRTVARRDDLDAVVIPRRDWVFGAPLVASGFQHDAHVRFFRAGTIDWPTHVHGRPSLAYVRVAHLPRGAGLDLDHDTWRTAASALDRLSRYTAHEVQNFGALAYEYSTAGVLRAAARAFVASFIEGQGYRDGERGFWTAIIMVLYQLHAHLYLWEAQGYPDAAPRSLIRWSRRGWTAIRAVRVARGYVRHILRRQMPAAAR
jgi:glycosyltransferase involved in cell wall biosynthesis